MALQLHKLGTGPGVPHSQHLLCAPGHDHGASRVHGQAIDAVLVSIEAASGYRVVAGCEGG